MDLILLIISSLTILALLVLLHTKISKSSKTLNPPGPPALPFIGNLHQLDISNLHECLRKLSDRYGPVMLMKFGSIPTLVISSARLAEEVMKNQDSAFCSRPKMKGQQKLSYGGLDIAFAPFNEEWRERRKICVLHLLSTKRIHQFRPIREDEASRMIEKMKKDALLNKDTNLSETLQSVTSLMICRIAFGKRIDPESPRRKQVDVIFKEMPTLFLGFFFSDYFPRVGWMDYVTGKCSRLDGIFQKVDFFLQELVDEHLDPNRPNSMDDDLIDIMLQLQRDGSTSMDITVDHIKAMLMNVFLAGSHTSAATTIWAMTILMKNPSIMHKLQAEIRQAMGTKEILDEDDVADLPYLTATVKETFRLFPVGPLLVPRMTMKKCTLDGYEIEPQTTVYVNAWAIGRDGRSWENSDEFSPERFLNSEKSSMGLNGQDFELIPFGSGRRSCPGYLMGQKTVYLLLANLLHSFDWELPSGMMDQDLDLESSPGLAMEKKNDLKLVAKIPM